MTRAQLEHVIRAAADIADDDEVVVIGSQAILGQFPDAPPELLRSVEADVFPKNHPERWDLIDGSIGELSPFHDTFGYYAQGVGEETATLPRGWRGRLVPIRNANTRMATGWCLEIHDLLLSKCVAWREKDREFIAAALKHGLASVEQLKARLAELELSGSLREEVKRRVDALGRGTG
ncbi:MAG: DUF6036 family nucleotidyltransferase [Myxococcaceae bacterium]